MGLKAVTRARLLATAIWLTTPIAYAATEAPPDDGPDRPVAIDPQIREADPAVAINPKDGKMLVAMRIRAIVPFDDERCLIDRSSDGGRTWTTVGELPTPGATRCATGDIRYAPNGSRLYAARTLYTLDPPQAAIIVSVSTDDGQTWTDHRVIGRGLFETYSNVALAVPNAGGNPDEVWLATIGRPWSDDFMSVLFTRSTNRGLTWTAPETLQHSVRLEEAWLGDVRLGTDGQREVLVGWNANVWDPLGHEIRVARSGNGGETFDPIKIAVRQPFGFSEMVPSLAVGHDGSAHLVYSARGFHPDPREVDWGDIYYVSSRSPYRRWSNPVRLSHGTPGTLQTSPSITAQRCGCASILHVVWADNQLTPPGFFTDRWNLFYTRKLALPKGDWSREIRVSGRSSLWGGPADNDIAAGKVRVYAVWSEVTSLQRDDGIYGNNIFSGITCP